MKKSDRIMVASIILVLLLVLVGTAAAATPSVRVTKEPATQTVKPGEPASFTFTLTNTGDVELTPIWVQDYINGVRIPECCRNLTGLQTGESTSYTCWHAGETASYTNIVFAAAWSPTTGTVTSWNDSAEVTVVPWNPAVRVTKEPATQTVKPGEPASFTFTLTNNGDVNLTPIWVQDYINGVRIPECCRNLTGLPPGESTSYTCSHAGETASYTNIVSAFAWSPTTGTLTSSNDSAEVTVVPWNPSVRVTKEPATQTVRPGDPASFTFTLANNGDVNLTPIMVSDYINGVRIPECSRNLTGLTPGGSTSYTCSHGGETKSYTNIVFAAAWSPTTGTLTSSNDSAEVTVVPWNPSVLVTKEPATQTVRPGDPASFTFTLTNNGEVNLTPIAVLDYINGVKIPECSRNLTGLTPGESTSYTCSHGGEMASYTNIVSAYAWSPVTGTIAMRNDSAEVTVVPWNPSVLVTKEPATQTVRPGDPASFTFTLTNNGEVNLTPIAVLDYINGVKIPECCRNLTGLTPGESTSYTCSHGGETKNYTNIVSAHAWSPVTGTIALSNDSAEVTVANAIPVIAGITVPMTPQAVKSTVSVSGTFTDPDAEDTHTAMWTWGDSGTRTGVVNEATKTVTGTYAYTQAGIYTISLKVTDNYGGSGELAADRYIVIYDPKGGYVTGNGYINSPAGAFKGDPTLTGPATFGFTSKYQMNTNKKGAPTTSLQGTTAFQFQLAGLSFRSTQYDWMVVAGPKVMYKGTGTINKKGQYAFLLSAVDGQLLGGGGTDKFRIKIWDKFTGLLVYDNQLGAKDDADPTTAIAGGSIIITKP